MLQMLLLWFALAVPTASGGIRFVPPPEPTRARIGLEPIIRPIRYRTPV